jgi:putative glutamine amidotransferase
MNVALGGTLHQEVHNVGYSVHKEDPEQPLEVQYGPSHGVRFTRGGWLHGLVGVEETVVNSLHSQGVDELAEGVEIEAAAEDGLVEAFSVRNAEAFALAVQWHPEWQASENSVSRSIFGAFGAACRDHGGRRG